MMNTEYCPTFLKLFARSRGESQHWKDNKEIVAIAPHQGHWLLLQPEPTKLGAVDFFGASGNRASGQVTESYPPLEVDEADIWQPAAGRSPAGNEKSSMMSKPPCHPVGPPALLTALQWTQPRDWTHPISTPFCLGNRHLFGTKWRILMAGCRCPRKTRDRLALLK